LHFTMTQSPLSSIDSEWTRVGQDFALSKDQIKIILVTETNLVNVLVDIILDFLRRDQYALSNMKQLGGMYGTFGKTANVWGQVISVPSTCAYLHNFTVMMKISGGDVHLRLVLYEWLGHSTLSHPLFRSNVHIVPNGHNAPRTFEVPASEQYLIPPCDPEKKYLVGIVYEDVHIPSASEIGYVPYTLWHKPHRSVYGVYTEGSGASGFSDLGSYGLAFSLVFTSNSWG